MPENTQKTEVQEETRPELVTDEFEGLDVSHLIPTMNVSKDMIPQPEAKECIIKDEVIIGLYDEILDDCREDRKKVDEMLNTFLDMVINDGDASTSSKEAVVNLMKMRSDISDKKSKIADLYTRHKLKEKDTFKPYLNAQQNNKVVIEGSKRDMLKAISKAAAKKGKG